MAEFFDLESQFYANFIDYTKLRQNIRRIVFLEQHPSEIMTFGEQTMLAAANAANTNPANAHLRSIWSEEGTNHPGATSASLKLREIFWHFLCEEVTKVEAFYQRQVQELAMNPPKRVST